MSYFGVCGIVQPASIMTPCGGIESIYGHSVYPPRWILTPAATRIHRSVRIPKLPRPKPRPERFLGFCSTLLGFFPLACSGPSATWAGFRFTATTAAAAPTSTLGRTSIADGVLLEIDGEAILEGSLAGLLVNAYRFHEN